VSTVAIEPIRVDGLKEFQRDLKKMGGELPTALRLAANSAAQLVVDEAKPRVPVGPGKGGHASASIKAASTRTAARVSAGGKKYPYYPWLDFGGSVGPQKSSQRPFLKQGRYIWKAYADNDEKVQMQLAEALADVARQAGLEIS
jgi:HK97 gp10 family phage protein